MKSGVSILLVSFLLCLSGCRDTTSESIKQMRSDLKVEQVFFCPTSSNRISLTPGETVAIKRIAGKFLEKDNKVVKHVMGYQYGGFQFGETIFLWQGDMLYHKEKSTDNIVIIEDMALGNLSNAYFKHLGKPPYRNIEIDEWKLILSELDAPTIKWSDLTNDTKR